MLTIKKHTISCGRSHSVALLFGGTVRCWGDNTYNQCDPVHLSFKNVTQVDCGNFHSVALFDNGTIQCWGNNDEN